MSQNIPSISVKSLQELISGGKQVKLIDVRTPAEFRGGHIAIAESFPLARLDYQQLKEDCADCEEVYFVCQGGVRSLRACENLAAAGLSSVVNVEGGTRAWIDGGFGVTKVQGAVSIPRQVQVVSGSLVLTGLLLGWLLTPWLYWLAAFIGAGTVFAGVTDTCGMGRVLMRMPWNQ